MKSQQKPFPHLWEIDRELAERSLSEFLKQAWPVLEPETEYRHNWHIDAIAEHLEAVSRGEIKKLIINVPPGHMKSLSCCVFWPAWDWINKPHLRWLFASYASDLSERDSRKTKALVQSSWYQSLWGGKFSLTKENERRIDNDHTGFRLASSVGGVGTGERVHRVVNDDLLKANQAHSEAERQAAIRHLRAMSTRGVSKDDFAQVLIMQRLHEGDPTQWAIDQGGWEMLILPAEFEPSRAACTSIGFVDPRAEEGELLWPSQCDAAALVELKTALGSYEAAAQLQQRPSPAGGGIFKRDWWQFYTVAPSGFDDICQSWDMAFKGEETSDPVAGHVWAKRGADYYLLDRVNDRMDFVASKRAVETLTAKWPRVNAKLIEEKANGAAIISALKKTVSGLIAVNPEGGKESRARAVSPIVEAGNVYLPDPSIAPWVHDFIEQFASFPKGRNDDDVDAMSQALSRMSAKKKGGFSSGEGRVM